MASHHPPSSYPASRGGNRRVAGRRGGIRHAGFRYAVASFIALPVHAVASSTRWHRYVMAASRVSSVARSASRVGVGSMPNSLVAAVESSTNGRSNW